MKRKLLRIVVVFACLSVFSTLAVNKYFPYLRTDILRSFAKGNWCVLSEKDVLYTMGYHGVQKYLVEDSNQMTMVAENDDFCVDRMIGRSGCIYGDYLFVTVRSFLPGRVTTGDPNGKLLVMRKGDLSIVKEIESDMKLVEANVHDKVLVVSGLGGFDIYDLSNPEAPKPVYNYRHDRYLEYQGFDFFEEAGRLYVAFALFGEGLDIWDVSEGNNAKRICEIPIKSAMSDGQHLPGGQSMDVVSNYPYIYASLGPTRGSYDTDRDTRGVLVYDVSNLGNITKSAYMIPREDWYDRTTGDRQPTSLARYGDLLFQNFAERGVAVFDITVGDKPAYMGCVDLSGRNALIQPVCTTGNGEVFTGSYFWPSLYGMPVNEVREFLEKK